MHVENTEGILDYVKNVLSFYSDENNYKNGMVVSDNGNMAKQALYAIKKVTEYYRNEVNIVEQLNHTKESSTIDEQWFNDILDSFKNNKLF